MSFFPCKFWTDCEPVADLPLRNLSAENPDRFSAFGFYACDPVGTNPLLSTCESPISQAAADACAAACLAAGVFTNDAQTCAGPCGSSFTVPSGTIPGNSVEGANATALAFACASADALCLAGNAASTCNVVCPNSAISSYTVPANSFRGPSQAVLDQQAQALACEIANLLCFGALVFNAEQSCSIICLGTGGTATVVIPAGIVLGFTVESANARALELACALALIACDSLPPLVGNTVQSCSQICEGVTISYVVPEGAFVAATVEEANLIASVFCFLTLSFGCQTGNLPPAPANVGNQATSCSLACEGGTFNATVQAGAFRLENLQAANQAALSYCLAHIYPNSFCLGDLTAGICVNEIYVAAVSVTGPSTPTTMGVTSGVLPPGLSLSGGLVSGIPNTPGVFAFRIVAASASGFASRDYVISVGEVTPDILPDAPAGVAYAQTLTATGFTSPQFSVVGGSLPSGLSLSPFSGVISGTPDGAPGISSFVVQVAES